MDLKNDLVTRVQGELESLIGKAEGLAEHDVRRPLVRTGSNIPDFDDAAWAAYRARLEEIAASFR